MDKSNDDDDDGEMTSRVDRLESGLVIDQYRGLVAASFLDRDRDQLFAASLSLTPLPLSLCGSHQDLLLLLLRVPHLPIVPK